MADTDLPPAAAPTPADGAAAPLGSHVPPGTLMERMGIEIQEVSAERAVGTMPVAETLGSYAANAHAGPDRRAVGIELSCTHHRSATEGVVTGTATAVHLGGRVATYDVVVSDPRGRRVCSA